MATTMFKRRELRVSARATRAPRAEEIRLSLPGQKAVREREQILSLVQAEFGLSYTKREIARKILQTAPTRGRNRWGWVDYDVRLARTPLEQFAKPIPDAALLKYQAAKESGHFESFEVGEIKRARRPVRDPWLLGKVRGLDAYVVLAYWE